MRAGPSDVKAVVFPDNSRCGSSYETAADGFSQLIDRPLLQHVVEYVVDLGIRDLTFVLRSHEHFVRAFLGDGTRWGARFLYRSAVESTNGYDVIDACARDVTTVWLLVVHGNRLPAVSLDAKRPVPTLFCWGDGSVYWTGWALVPVKDARDIPATTDEQGLRQLLLSRGGICIELRRPLTARTYHEVIDSTHRVLSGEFPGLLLGAPETRPGVWIARNARVHRTAALTPPVFLGENCRIGPFVRIGPSASVGRNCVIDRDTHVADSVVYDGSYVGPELVLRRVVVDRSRLVNTRWDAEIEGVDELLLADVFGRPLRTRVRELCRVIAADLALIVAAPTLAILVAGGFMGWVPRLRRHHVVAAPTVSDPHRWKTFVMWSFGPNVSPEGRTGWVRHLFFCFLPGLLAVSAGRVALTGPRPRTVAELTPLSSLKRAAYVRSRPGLLPHGRPATSSHDDDLAVDAHQGWRETLAVARAYFGRVLESGRFGIVAFTQRRAG